MKTRVLFVDDDKVALNGYKLTLGKKFDITTALNGPEAIEIVKSSKEFAVVVSDFNMPGMNGNQLLKEIGQISSNTTRVLLTAFADVQIAMNSVNEGHVFRFLTKPISIEMLESAVVDAIEQYRLVTSEQRLNRELNKAYDKLHEEYEKVKSAEESTRTNESRLSALIANIQAGVLVEDRKRRIVLTNDEFCRMFAIPVPAAALVGADCSNSAEQSKHLFRDPKEFVRRIEELLERRQASTNETLYLADGRIFDRDYVPIWVDNEYYGHFWQYRDVTERKTFEQKLMIRDRAIASSNDGIIIVDAQKSAMPVIYANKGFEKITGFSYEEVIGKNLAFLHRGDRDQPGLSKLRRAIANKEPAAAIIRNYRKDGTLFWNELSISPIFDEHGNIQHFIGIENDITARVEAEQLLRETNYKLENAYGKIRDDLLAAAEIQRSLLPVSSSRIHDIEFDWLFLPSAFVSGDIFNFFPLDDHSVAFYQIDVAGHGIASALSAVTLSRLLTLYDTKRSPLMQYDHELHRHVPRDPASVVTDLNSRLVGEGDAMNYFTIIYGIVNSQKNKVTFCQAGHPSPILLRQNGETVVVGSTGFPVGMLEDCEYENTEFEFMPGERLFVFSDGVTECANPGGELFTRPRVRKTLENHAHIRLPAILKDINRVLRDWHGENEFEDDLSILTLENKKGAQKDSHI
ncbi:MAG: SpoIIE family protein phosphatase [Candidatus Kapaibacterium sp.]